MVKLKPKNTKVNKAKKESSKGEIKILKSRRNEVKLRKKFVIKHRKLLGKKPLKNPSITHFNLDSFLSKAYSYQRGISFPNPIYSQSLTLCFFSVELLMLAQLKNRFRIIKSSKDIRKENLFLFKLAQHICEYNIAKNIFFPLHRRN